MTQNNANLHLGYTPKLGGVCLSTLLFLMLESFAT